MTLVRTFSVLFHPLYWPIKNPENIFVRCETANCVVQCWGDVLKVKIMEPSRHYVFKFWRRAIRMILSADRRWRLRAARCEHVKHFKQVSEKISYGQTNQPDSELRVRPWHPYIDFTETVCSWKLEKNRCLNCLQRRPCSKFLRDK